LRCRPGRTWLACRLQSVNGGQCPHRSRSARRSTRIRAAASPLPAPARRPRLTLLPAGRRLRRPRPGGPHRLHEGRSLLPRRARLELPHLRRAVRLAPARDCAHGGGASKAPAAQRVGTRPPGRTHVGSRGRPRGAARPARRPGPAGRARPGGPRVQRARAQSARPRPRGLVDRGSRQAARTTAPQHRQRAATGETKLHRWQERWAA
jgi:hypothetical protein